MTCAHTNYLSDVSFPMRAVSEAALRQSSSSRRQLSELSDRDVSERILDFLNNIHPQKTAECVSAETGIPASTIAQWIARSSAPKTANFVRLFLAYGPEFLAAVMRHPPAWLDAAARAESQSRLRAEIAALQKRLGANE